MRRREKPGEALKIALSAVQAGAPARSELQALRDRCPEFGQQLDPASGTASLGPRP